MRHLLVNDDRYSELARLDAASSMPVYVRMDESIPLDSSLLNRIVKSIRLKKNVGFYYKSGKIGTDAIFAVCFFKGLPDLTLDNLHGCQNLGDHGLADALDLKNIFLPCGEQTCQAAEAFKHFPAKLNGGLAFSSCAQ
ncbi:MAG TPA: hypothetical protein PLT64_07845 [Syntrophales bacterium]|nr:hypothetical protein [Syntrophales bacterium]HOL59757.1 hypothetical protein [Syntrophales bacterium]HPO35933.1 hypothetical protein [Syntrophales bacterium]